MPDNMRTATVTKATQVARALRELGFNDMHLLQQRARRAYLKGDKTYRYDTREGWFRIHQDPRTRGRRVKVVIRAYGDENKEELLKAEEAVQNMIPQAYILWSPNEMMLTITWFEPTVLRARGKKPTYGLVG